MRLPRLLAIAAVTTLALGSAACASDDADEPEASTPAPSQSIDTSGAPDASPSPSTEPEPSASETPAPSDDAQSDGGIVPAAYVPLEGDPPGTIARADLAVLDGAPSSSSTVVGVIVSGQTFVVEGQCTGGPSMGFRLDRAIDGTPEERLLLEGTIACDAEPSQGYALSAPYDGPAQLSITASGGVTQAWLVVARSQ